MITEKILEETKNFALENSNTYLAPGEFHIGLANDKGQEIAKKINADPNIVLMATLLMDIELGRAMKENRIKEHIRMGIETAKKFLSQFSELTDKEKENILKCIEEHHGGLKFSSLEAEVVCNADCYRFASAKGNLGGMLNRKLSLPWKDLVKLFSDKADEKFNALTFDFCKEELEPEYKIIKAFLAKSLA